MTFLPASAQHLLSRAQQGDAHALDAMLNRTLAPLGVVVTTVINAECAIVTAVLPHGIDRQFLIRFMREGMERLQARSIRQVLLVGRDRERSQPDWQYILNLYQADLPPSPQPQRRRRAAVTATATPTIVPLIQPRPRAAIGPRRLSRPLYLLLLLATVALLAGGTWAGRTVLLVDSSLDHQWHFPQEVEQLTSNTAVTSVEQLATASVGYLRGLKQPWCVSNQGWQTVVSKAIGMGLLERRLISEDRQELWVAGDPSRRFSSTTTVADGVVRACVQPLP